MEFYTAILTGLMICIGVIVVIQFILILIVMIYKDKLSYDELYAIDAYTDILVYAISILFIAFITIKLYIM